MTKRTPLERYRRALERFDRDHLDGLEEIASDNEKMHRAETDPNLSPNERLDEFMSVQAWPRIVLGLYEAELEIAQKERREKGKPRHGREEPSEIAAITVGSALGLGPDRIHDLCREGRWHLKRGMPPKLKLRAAVFAEKILRGRVTRRPKRPRAK